MDELRAGRSYATRAGSAPAYVVGLLLELVQQARYVNICCFSHYERGEVSGRTEHPARVGGVDCGGELCKEVIFAGHGALKEMGTQLCNPAPPRSQLSGGRRCCRVA